MNESAIIICIGLSILLVPSSIWFVSAEIQHQRNLRRMAQAQRNVAELLGRRASK
jgi:hypothetical protein